LSRLPQLTREQIAPGHLAIWDRIAGTRKGVWGPYQVLMHVPPLAEPVAAVGEYLRFHGTLPGADRELAIIAAAREIGSQYEWAIHEPVAHAEGTSVKAIETVRSRGSLDALAPREQLIVELVRTLYRDRWLSDELFDRAINTLGREQTVEVVTIVGFYNLLAFVLQGFAIPLPEGSQPGFPHP
jgi:4-carboxymuconolactone decarboxylase